MSAVIDYKDSERMVHAFANRVVRRLRSLPQSVMSRNDIVQELWIAWCKARDVYDADTGVPWSAFLHRGMRHHINRVIESQIERFEGQTFALSLDQEIKTDGSSDAQGTTLQDLIPSDAPDPSDQAERDSNYQKALSVMSRRSAIFVSLLKDQPEDLLNEVLVGQDKMEHAKKIGAPFAAPRRVTASMVFDLMGASRNERTKIMKEVESLGMRMSK